MKDLEEDHKTMPFLEHLEEFRKTILHSLAAVGIGAVAAWAVSDRVLTWLISQTSGKAIFMRPEGAFIARLKVAVILGVLLVLPYVFYRIWSFVGPGLLSKERRFVLPGALSSVTLFYLGLAFSYMIMTPLIVRVLLGFGTANLQAQTEVNFLLDLLFMTGIACGLVFQMPLFVGFLTWIGILNPRILRRYWRHSIVVIFIMAAVLTPADPVSQLVLAIPLLVLYGISLLVSAFIHRARMRARGKLPAPEEAAGT